MFNERKLTTNHGFVKAYSNNWLSQLGAVYKYESPKDVLRKPNYQHRKIALYSILAMAFVAFFTLFMIVHEAERKSRQLVIESSFSNETAIEPSAGSQDTILTTPFSSGGMPVGNGTSFLPAPSGMEGNGAESRAVVMESREPAMKRTRRLRYYGDGVDGASSNRAPVGRDRLVLLPARFLKPPPPGPMGEGNAGRKWLSENQEPIPAREEADRRRDGGAPSHPKPFHIAPNGPLPVGFQQPQQEQPVSGEQSRANRSLESLAADLGPFSIQDIIRQLTLAKRKQQQQFYYNYPYRPSPQPSEFNHPVHQNHRVKFTGIYRHPRKNGDITTVFGAASQRPQEVHVQAPQLINQQLGTMGASNLMPDRLYNFKPQNPSEVNLLATDQFRFAPQKDLTEDSWASRWPKEGMPFSVMLNLEPMGSIGGRPPAYQQQQQQQQQQQRYKKRFRNPQRPHPYRQAWGGSGGNYGEQQFAQLSPYHHRSRPQNNLYRDAFGQAGGDDYEGENYFRKEGRVQPRIPAYASPLIGPGRLMVHLNIFPRQQPPAARRNSGLESDETRFQPSFGSVELNTGEKRTPKELLPASSTPTAPTDEELTPPPQWNVEGRNSGQWNPIPTLQTFNWTSTFPVERNLSTIVLEQPSSPTVEVIKSIEIPTQINFDHVPLGRNPPPPLPSFNRWTGDEATIKLWSTHSNIKRA
ncbi:AGAP006465-PA-like protein [Anopheles sinensis]|uniref:AGAP006465-PA-like protein n=1 Tax=Anopheles sinensis TaxID=74873 RepID=A0A084VAZ3_ANOSI|nr:AGAP006465-PA-like protein [Anopheles sinensis]